MNLPVKSKKKDDEIVIHHEALHFLPDAQEIENAPLPRAARLTTITLLSLLLFLIIWACVFDVDIIVNAKGRIISPDKEITVAAAQDAMIKSIDVKIGQTVNANDTLVTLDPTVMIANKAQQLFKLNRQIIVIHRLHCELEGTPFKPDVQASAEEIASQRNILRDRMDEYTAKITLFDSKISETKGNIASLEKQSQISAQQEKIGREVLSMRAQVFQQGVDSKLSYLDAQHTHANLLANNERIQKDFVASKKFLVQIQAEKEAYVSSWRKAITQEIAEAEKELAITKEELAKATRYKELTTITAPVTAMVLDILKYPSDSVVKNGEPIMVLAPLQTPLEAEVHIEPRDIGFIRTNDPTNIKLEAFPYHKYGIILGKLRSVGEDSLAKDKGNQGPSVYYPARIEFIDMSRLRNLPTDFRLMPGMTLDSSIIVGQRKVITYLLYPVLRALDESIRER